MDAAHEGAARAVVRLLGIRERFYETPMERFSQAFAWLEEPSRGIVLDSIRRNLERSNPWEEIEGLAAEALAKHLSEDELYAVGQLFQQPAGQRWLQVADKVQVALGEALWGRQQRLFQESLGINENPF